MLDLLDYKLCTTTIIIKTITKTQNYALLLLLRLKTMHYYYY